MIPSASPTIIVVMTTHRNEGSARSVLGERQDAAAAPPSGPPRMARSENVLPQLFYFLNLHAGVVGIFLGKSNDELHIPYLVKVKSPDFPLIVPFQLE